MEKKKTFKYAVFSVMVFFLLGAVICLAQEYEVLDSGFSIGTTKRSEWHPWVEYNSVDDEFLVIWRTSGKLRDDCEQDDDYECGNSFQGVMGQRISAEGTLLGDPITISPEEGPNADQNDGQGCWNRAREDAVAALIPWLDRLAQEYGTARALIIGDMNAWRREDPIQAFLDGGYSELVEELAGLPQHSFLYFGKRGTLDYVLASPAMRDAARKAFIWHINADWPRGMPLPEPWLRMSDHDPVVVDLDFSQAFASD